MLTHSNPRIDILLKEYDSLRAEMISRCNNRFAMLGIIGGIIAFISAYPCLTTWVLGGIAVLFLLCVWAYLGHLIYNCGIRVAAIERQINEIAGEKLLAWESEEAPKIAYWPLTFSNRRGRNAKPPGIKED
ncbi:MAG: hypothetical protein KAV00_11435 [Phycisphaerae bacterium]|nr:hypothetical protein [Phycisphaerae bacterium]